MFQVGKLTDHLADRNLALLFVLVRLNRVIAIQLGKRAYVSQRGLCLPAVPGNIESLSGIELPL